MGFPDSTIKATFFISKKLHFKAVFLPSITLWEQPKHKRGGPRHIVSREGGETKERYRARSPQPVYKCVIATGLHTPMRYNNTVIIHREQYWTGSKPTAARSGSIILITRQQLPRPALHWNIDPNPSQPIATVLQCLHACPTRSTAALSLHFQHPPPSGLSAGLFFGNPRPRSAPTLGPDAIAPLSTNSSSVKKELVNKKDEPHKGTNSRRRKKVSKQ